MNNRLTNVRIILIFVMAFIVAAGILSLMDEQYVLDVNNVATLARPSAWTLLGVLGSVVPVLVVGYGYGNWVFNRPGAATHKNQLPRTIASIMVQLALSAVIVGIVNSDPLEGDNAWIFGRGLISGLGFISAIVISMWVSRTTFSVFRNPQQQRNFPPPPAQQTP